MELTVTSRGRLTLNKRLMEHLGIKQGEKASVTKTPEGLSVTAVKNKISLEEALARFRKLRGAAGGNKISLTLEEINDAIAQGYTEAGMRGLE
jgi:bifunctional DNA-binding transcriptional regulator/antitoxin component of YhaV-PrlF toxin-antitoxin module